MARIEAGRGVTSFLSSSDGSIDISSSIDFAFNDKAYHIKSNNSDLILSSSAGSYVTVSGNLRILGVLSASGTEIEQQITGTTNFFVTNTLDVRGRITNSVGHLVLSGSGSVSGNTIVAVSSSQLRVIGSFFDDENHITLYGSGSNSIDFYLQSGNQFKGAIAMTTGGQMRISTNYDPAAKFTINATGSAVGNNFPSERLTVSGNINLAEANLSTIYASSSHLILSSAVGSLVVVSGSLSLPATNKNYHINTPNSDLIFSSSTQVHTFSGSGIFLKDGSASPVAVRAYSVNDGGVAFYDHTGSFRSGIFALKSGNMQIFAVNDANVIKLKITTNGLAVGNANDGDANAVNSKLTVSGSIGLWNANNSSLHAFNSHLILSSAVGSIVAVSSSLDFPNFDKNYHIRSVNSDLILSSSTGICSFSGSTIQINPRVGAATLQLLQSGSSSGAIQLLNLTSNFLASIAFVSSGKIRFFTEGNGTTSKAVISSGGLAVGNGLFDPTERLTVSGNINLSDQTLSTIYANNNHLILSSSAGSFVTVSGSLKVTSNIVANATQAGVTVDTTAVVVDSFSTTDFRTIKYTISINSGSSYQAQELLLLHDGTSVDTVEYAILTLPGSVPFVGFVASITGSTANLIASGTLPGNNVKFIRNAVII